jgi:hypothetical protein
MQTKEMDYNGTLFITCHCKYTYIVEAIYFDRDTLEGTYSSDADFCVECDQAITCDIELTLDAKEQIKKNGLWEFDNIEIDPNGIIYAALRDPLGNIHSIGPLKDTLDNAKKRGYKIKGVK